MLRRKRSVSCGENARPVIVKGLTGHPEMSEWDELKLPFERMTSTSSVSSEPIKPHQRSSAGNSRQNSKRSSPLSIFAHRDKDFSSLSRPHTPSDSSSPSLTILNNALFDLHISSALREAHDITEFRLRTQSDTKEVRHRNHYKIPVEGDHIIMANRRRSRLVNEQDKGDIDTWFAISKACANLGF